MNKSIFSHKSRGGIKTSSRVLCFRWSYQTQSSLAEHLRLGHDVVEIMQLWACSRAAHGKRFLIPPQTQDKELIGCRVPLLGEPLGSAG